MRTHTMLTGALAALLASSAAQAQTAPITSATEPRMHGGVSLLGAAPQGDFGDQIERAFGLGGHLRYRLDSAGHVAMRADASWLIHGLDHGDVALASPLGGTRTVDLTTTNNLVFVGVGPELSASVAGVRPYVAASAGLAYFVTDASGDRRSDGVRVVTRVQHEDLVFAYGGQAGVRIPVQAGARNLSIDLGARYQHSDRADFLRKGDLRVDESGTMLLDPVRANADVWVFSAGVSVPVTKRERPGGGR